MAAAVIYSATMLLATSGYYSPATLNFLGTWALFELVVTYVVLLIKRGA